MEERPVAGRHPGHRLEPLHLLGAGRQLRHPLPPPAAAQFPRTECLKDTVERFLPYWHETIAPAVRSGKKVVIAAHGNSLRALIKYLDNVSDDDIVGLNIPTAQPLVYELDADLKPIRNYYLGDADAIKAAMAAVANQGKAKA